MGLLVTTLTLKGFRSFSSKEISFSPTVTVLSGHNAAGKTNTVEALQLLTSGVSFRHPVSSQLIKEGQEEAYISLSIEGDGRVLETRCEINKKGKTFFKNTKKCRSYNIPGTLSSILFTPDDLSLIKRGSSYRRDEIDYFARQVNAGYAKVLSSYTKAVIERNRVLKEAVPDQKLLLAWDDVIAKGGATLLHARLRLFSRLVKKTTPLYTQLSGGEDLQMRYQSSLGELPEDPSKDELREYIEKKLFENREEDLRRQQSCIGPHRDDILFYIDEKDAKTYGSQGQQRSIVLTLKMAEILIAEELLNEKPLLLLDDVMSELDEKRRREVVSFALSGAQTVITTANLGYFPKELLNQAKVVTFDE